MNNLRKFFVLPTIVFGAGMISCSQPGYRVEVTPGQQGQTEIRRVPLTPEEQARQKRMREVSAIAARPADSDLLVVESLWPRISPADRAAILDIARKSGDSEK